MTYRETVGKVAEELFYSLSKHISRSISRAAKWKKICPFALWHKSFTSLVIVIILFEDAE